MKSSCNFSSRGMPASKQVSTTEVTDILVFCATLSACLKSFGSSLSVVWCFGSVCLVFLISVEGLYSLVQYLAYMANLFFGGQIMW